jgi:hypothetical protein
MLFVEHLPRCSEFGRESAHPSQQCSLHDDGAAVPSQMKCGRWINTPTWEEVAFTGLTMER